MRPDGEKKTSVFYEKKQLVIDLSKESKRPLMEKLIDKHEDAMSNKEVIKEPDDIVTKDFDDNAQSEKMSRYQAQLCKCGPAHAREDVRTTISEEKF